MTKIKVLLAQNKIKKLIGIIPRMMDCLFEQIINANEDLEFTVKCSMLEIYNEKLHDLIERSNKTFFFLLNKHYLKS